MLIGFTGRKTAGKDTCYERMALLAPTKRYSFVDSMYVSASAALSTEEVVLRRLKNDPGALVTVEASIPEDHPLAPGKYIVAQVTVREFLQKYGVEAHRDVFGIDFWVEALDLEAIKDAEEFVVITDCRFENEAIRIEDAGGIVCRVLGPPDVEDVGDEHPSEQPLDTTWVHTEIDNSVRDDDYASLDGQLWELIQMCRAEA